MTGVVFSFPIHLLKCHGEGRVSNNTNPKVTVSLVNGYVVGCVCRQVYVIKYVCGWERYTYYVIPLVKTSYVDPIGDGSA